MGREKKTAPKSYKVRLSANAVQNIDEITGYIAFLNQQPLNAIKVGDALLETIDRIAAHPYPGRYSYFPETICYKTSEKD